MSNNAVDPFMREATGITQSQKEKEEEENGEEKEREENAWKSAALSIRGSGHQALCDVPLLHAPWTNKLVRQTFDGAKGLELSKSVNSVIVGFLENVGMLETNGSGNLGGVPGVFALSQTRS